jgi:hypothetical protein
MPPAITSTPAANGGNAGSERLNPKPSPFTLNGLRDKAGLLDALPSLMDICVKSLCLGGRSNPPAKSLPIAEFDESKSWIERLMVERVVSDRIEREREGKAPAEPTVFGSAGASPSRRRGGGLNPIGSSDISSRSRRRAMAQ